MMGPECGSAQGGGIEGLGDNINVILPVYLPCHPYPLCLAVTKVLTPHSIQPLVGTWPQLLVGTRPQLKTMKTMKALNIWSYTKTMMVITPVTITLHGMALKIVEMTDIL